jgi:hypothetical protein
MGPAGHDTHEKHKTAYRILVGTLDVKNPLGKPKRR